MHQNETSPPPWDVRASEDVAHVVDFLITGLYTDDEALFSGFVTWTAATAARSASVRIAGDLDYETADDLVEVA